MELVSVIIPVYNVENILPDVFRVYVGKAIRD